MSTDINIEDAAALKAATHDVRNDKTETNWMAAHHPSGKPNLIALKGSGTGGVSEMLAMFPDDEVTYGLVRVTEQVDMSVTTKFVFVHCLGSKVGFVKKGRFGVVKGAVVTHFEPYHVDFSVESASEISEAAVKQKVAEASMQADKILTSTEGRQMRGFTANPTNQDSPNLNRQLNSEFSKVKVGDVTENATVAIGDDVKTAIADIRSDGNSTNWMVCSYPGGNEVSKPISVIGRGEGDVEELKACFKDDMIAYGMLKTGDVFDGIKTVKFVYLNWVGDQVPHMAKAKVSTHKGAVESVFGRCHVDFKGISRLKDLTAAEIKSKVEAASGSANHVVAK